jgi:hypothetical protein
MSAWVMCGRRLGKNFLDGAALVGCGHVSGLVVRLVWPLAIMLCADRVPRSARPRQTLGFETPADRLRAVLQ